MAKFKEGDIVYKVESGMVEIDGFLHHHYWVEEYVVKDILAKDMYSIKCKNQDLPQCVHYSDVFIDSREAVKHKVEMTSMFYRRVDIVERTVKKTHNVVLSPGKEPAINLLTKIPVEYRLVIQHKDLEKENERLKLALREASSYCNCCVPQKASWHSCVVTKRCVDCKIEHFLKEAEKELAGE